MISEAGGFLTNEEAMETLGRSFVRSCLRLEMTNSPGRTPGWTIGLIDDHGRIFSHGAVKSPFALDDSEGSVNCRF